MNTLKTLALAAAAAIVAGPAAAVTVKNVTKSDMAIGIDYGSTEKVMTIPAGKSVSFECKDGCGVSGPWSFTWKVSGDDEIVTDGQNLITGHPEKK